MEKIYYLQKFRESSKLQRLDQWLLTIWGGRIIEPFKNEIKAL